MSHLVTGVAGFIGSHLAETLLRDGHAVVGVDSFTDYYPRKLKLANLADLRKSKRFTMVEADLSTVSIPHLLKGVTCVFHLAAQPGVRASWGRSFSHYVKDNIVATQRLLEAAKDAHHINKVVYASSSSVYGDAERLPTPEGAMPRPVSPYGMTKLAGEHLCQVYRKNFSLPVVILRYFTVYGPRQRPDMAFNIFISKIARGREIVVYGSGDQCRDFTFVQDTVQATILASRAESGAVYNVGTGKTTPLRDVILKLEELIGKKARIKRVQAARGDVKGTSADITRIRKDLGFEPSTSLTEGLARQVKTMLE